jgi:hypothetical protein
VVGGTALRYAGGMDSANAAATPPLTLTPAVAALMLANFVPLAGVLFFGWSLFAVVFLYWMENVVIGLFNMMRMSRAQGSMPEGGAPKLNGKDYAGESRVALILFFMVHYGIFTFVHGMFVFVIFGPFDIEPTTFVLAVAALFVSHGISYMTNFIGRGEYLRVNETTLFMQPYKRIIILHVSILAGAFLTQLIGAPIIALVFFILLKSAVDMWAHVHEHEELAREPRS